MSYNVYNSGHVPVGTGQQLPQQQPPYGAQGQLNANVVTAIPSNRGVPARQVPGVQAQVTRPPVNTIPPHIQPPVLPLPVHPSVSFVAVREVPGTGLKVVTREPHFKKDPNGI